MPGKSSDQYDTKIKGGIIGTIGGWFNTVIQTIVNIPKRYIVSTLGLLVLIAVLLAALVYLQGTIIFAPTPTPTATATASPSATPSMTATASPTTTPSPTVRPSPTTTPSPTFTPPPLPEAHSLHFYIVLDASERMNSDRLADRETKWIVARKIVRELLESALPSRANYGLIVLGSDVPGSPQSCNQSPEPVVPLALDTRDEVLTTVESLHPQGTASLSEAVKFARDALLDLGTEQAKTIIIITGGGDECCENPEDEWNSIVRALQFSFRSLYTWAELIVLSGEQVDPRVIGMENVELTKLSRPEDVELVSSEVLPRMVETARQVEPTPVAAEETSIFQRTQTAQVSSTPTPTPAVTRRPSDTPSPTKAPSPTPTTTLTRPVTPPAQPTVTLTPTPAQTPSHTPTLTPMLANTPTNTPAPTFTPVPTDTSTPIPTPTHTSSPTSNPTDTPTATSTPVVTYNPGTRTITVHPCSDHEMNSRLCKGKIADVGRNAVFLRTYYLQQFGEPSGLLATITHVYPSKGINITLQNVEVGQYSDNEINADGSLLNYANCAFNLTQAMRTQLGLPADLGDFNDPARCDHGPLTIALSSTPVTYASKDKPVDTGIFAATDQADLGNQTITFRQFYTRTAAINGTVVNPGSDDNTGYRIAYDRVTPAHYACWGIVLSETDVSNLDRLAFDIKGQQGGELPNVWLASPSTPYDIRNVVDIEDYVTVTTSWQRVEIPLADFHVMEGTEQTVDLTQIMRVQICFEWEDMAGMVFVDGIAFESD